MVTIILANNKTADVAIPFGVYRKLDDKYSPKVEGGRIEAGKMGDRIFMELIAELLWSVYPDPKPWGSFEDFFDNVDYNLITANAGPLWATWIGLAPVAKGGRETKNGHRTRSSSPLKSSSAGAASTSTTTSPVSWWSAIFHPLRWMHSRSRT